MAAIKGLGQSTVNEIINARMKGPFRSIFDFTERLEQGTINRKALESLVCAGAFDSIKPPGSELRGWRAALNEVIDGALGRAQRARRERLLGQNGLFGDSAEYNQHDHQLRSSAHWTHSQLLAAEKTALGFYITGHPLESYVELLQSLKTVKSADLLNLNSGVRVSIGGIITDLQTRNTKRGDKFALLRLEDEGGGTKCVFWPEAFRKYSTVMQNELAVLITGRLELSEENPPTVIAEAAQTLDEILKQRETIVLRLPQNDDPEGFFDSILHLLNQHAGNCDVAVETLIDAETLVRVKTNSALRVERSLSLETALKQLGCVISVEKAELGGRV